MISFQLVDLTVAECKEKFLDYRKIIQLLNLFNFSFSLMMSIVPDTTMGESRDGRISVLIEKLIQCYPFTREPIILPGNHNLSSNLASMKEFCQRILFQKLKIPLYDGVIMLRNK